jgi:hypothetical protein
MNQETWKDIPGYEGLYQVSDQGDVRSLPRRSTPGKILTPQLNNSGYLRVAISAHQLHKYLYVHHLVTLTFIGQRPDKADVNHKNGIKTDNRVANLEYITRADNMKHARENGLHDNRGEKQWNSKLTEEQVREFRLAHNTCGIGYEYLSLIAQDLGVSERTLRDVLEGKTWRHINE